MFFAFWGPWRGPLEGARGAKNFFLDRPHPIDAIFMMRALRIERFLRNKLKCVKIAKKHPRGVLSRTPGGPFERFSGVQNFMDDS